MNHFGEFELYSKLIVTHYIEADSRKLFTLGLGMLRSMLTGKYKTSVEKAQKIIFDYEETCCNSTGSPTQRKSVLDLLHE